MTPPLIPPENLEEFIRLYETETDRVVIQQRFGLTWMQIKGLGKRLGIKRHFPSPKNRIFKTQKEIERFCRVVQQCEGTEDVMKIFPHLSQQQILNQKWKAGVSFKRQGYVEPTRLGYDSMRLILQSLEHMLRDVTGHRHNDPKTT